MKMLALLLILSLVGCTGMQIKDDATHKVLAYAAGKAMAISVNSIKPEVDAELTSAWVDIMEANADKIMISPADMVAFYNKCLYIVVGYNFDKYGLLADLSMLLTIYDAKIDPHTKDMTSILPVPMDILRTFEQGYANGRAISRR